MNDPSVTTELEDAFQGPVEPGTAVRLRAWASQSHVSVACLVFAVILIIGVIRNPWILTQGRIEDGDFAVNSILIDKALHFRLLVGNYSRVGFNHPGPALLSVQAGGQFLFYRLLHIAPRPYNAHVLSIVVFCAAMAALGSSVLVRRTQSMLSGLMLVPAVLLLSVAQRGAIASTSFPEIYIWPYLLLTVSAASVLSGEPRDLPWAVLAIGLLCHGHVSFALFAAGFLVAMGLAVWRRRRVNPIPRSTLVKCGLIASLFVFPFVLNLALHWPGELSKYWRYSRSSKTGGHAWSAILRFTASYWSVQGAIGYALVLGFLVATALLIDRVEHHVTRSMAFGLVVTTGLSTVLLILYAYRGIDDLAYRYVAEFYLNAPVGALLALGVACVPLVSANRLGRRSACTGLVAGIIILSAAPQVKALYPGANWVSDAEGFLDRTVPSGRTRVMRFPLDVWPGVAGIVEQTRRTGGKVCIDEAGYGFLFNKSMVCTAEQRATGVVIQGLPAGSSGAPDADVAARYASPYIVLEVHSGST